MSSAPRHRRRFTPLLAIAGLASAAALAAATTGVLSGFTASITNSANTVSTGTLLMQENGQSQTCLSTSGTAQIGSNTGTCATINKFGQANTLSIPGSTYTTTITIKNIGSIAANTFTLTPSGCTQTVPAAGTGSDTGFCGKVLISIEDDSVAASPSCLLGRTAGSVCPATPTANLTSWATALNLNATAGAVTAGTTRTYKFTVQIAAGADNTDQGLAASEPLVWAFGS